MATVTRENIGILNDKIIVKVASDDYLPSFQKILKDYSKKANIPGFRKGMVPMGMVKKMYGTSIFQDEVIKRVEKELQDYMTSEKLEIFANPLPLFDESPKIDMNEPAEYAFSFEVGLKPEFTIPDAGSLHLTRYKIIITDEMINEQIERMRTQFAESTDHETIASEESILHLAFTQTDEVGNPVGEETEKEVIVDFKKFSAETKQQLMGKALNDEILVQLSQAFEAASLPDIFRDLNLPETDPSRESLYFKIRINKISLSELPALDEAFFKTVYLDKETMTEEEFRNQVKSDLQAQWDAQSRNQVIDQLYHELLNHTEIAFPQEFLKRWMQHGLDKPKTPEQVEEEFPTFSNQLKWTLITDKLVEDNDIEVGPQDLRDHAKNQLLGYMGGSGINLDQPWINDYLDRMMKDKKFVEESFHRIRTDKVFEVLETKINPVETEIPEGDFTKMVEEHHHHH